jgi:hypothetical protein
MGGTAEITCNTVLSQFDPAEWMILDNTLDIVCQNEYWLHGCQTVGFLVIVNDIIWIVVI